MFKYYNHNLIHSKRPYTVEQICNLYKDKRLNPQTVRGWFKDHNLELISKRPIVIYGAILKDFLGNRNKGHKKQLNFDEIKCFSCKQVSKPQNNEMTLLRNKNGSFKALVFCDKCGGKNNRFYKKNDYEKLTKTFTVKQPSLPTLCNNADNACKTNLDHKQKPSPSESCKKIEPDLTNSASKTNLGDQLSLF